MTSHGELYPTTDAHKDNELRIPPRLIIDSYRGKRIKVLETFIQLKMIGSRVPAKRFFKSMGIHVKTGGRIIKKNDGIAVGRI
jgi:hypothetical protein